MGLRIRKNLTIACLVFLVISLATIGKEGKVALLCHAIPGMTAPADSRPILLVDKEGKTLILAYGDFASRRMIFLLWDLVRGTKGILTKTAPAELAITSGKMGDLEAARIDYSTGIVHIPALWSGRKEFLIDPSRLLLDYAEPHSRSASSPKGYRNDLTVESIGQRKVALRSNMQHDRLTTTHSIRSPLGKGAMLENVVASANKKSIAYVFSGLMFGDWGAFNDGFWLDLEDHDNPLPLGEVRVGSLVWHPREQLLFGLSRNESFFEVCSCLD